MENVTKYKTSINCNNCKARVKPFLDKVDGIIVWEVDLDHPEKILTVRASGTISEEVVKAVRKTGFSIEEIAT
jgi:copper chaperone